MGKDGRILRCGKLLINNSWSGSRVTKLPSATELFPSACSDERTNGLHDGKHNPDVIIIYLGTNYWAFGAQPERRRMGFQDEKTGMFVDGYVGKMDEQVFSVAYDTMLKKSRLTTRKPKFGAARCAKPFWEQILRSFFRRITADGRCIMITDKGQLKLIDFDIARRLPYSNGDHEIYGTRGYSAHEQFLPGASVDQIADVFSLGMTLYTLVTGIDPSEPPYVRLPIRKINADLSCLLEAFIEKCVDPNPDKRYRSAKELIESLDAIS